MELKDFLFEVELEELAQILYEKKGQNNTVASWAKKLGMSYDELHKLWDKAKEEVGSETNYFAIMGSFKKKVTSLKGVTKKALQADGGKATFNYKVRTQQTMKQALDDKPAPKSAKPGEVKKVKAKISAINKKMRDIKAKPNNTPLRKKRNKEALDKLKAQKKELQNSIK